MSDRLFEIIKDILTVGGGMTGAALGPFGALGGAALGRAGGEGIHNLYRQQSGQPTDNATLLKNALEGATMEAGGQVAGKAIGYGLDKLKPNVIMGEMGPVIQKHGSYMDIPNPEPKSRTGMLQAFHTTPNSDVANRYAGRQTELQFLGGNPEAKYTINEYVAKPAKTLDMVSDPVSGLEEFGRILKLSPDRIQMAINQTYGLNPPEFPGPNTYHAMRKMITQYGKANDMSFSEAQKAIHDLIRNAGYGRVYKPLLAEGNELIHLDPANQLIYKPEYDKQVANIETAKALMNILGKATTATNIKDDK